MQKVRSVISFCETCWSQIIKYFESWKVRYRARRFRYHIYHAIIFSCILPLNTDVLFQNFKSYYRIAYLIESKTPMNGVLVWAGARYRFNSTYRWLNGSMRSSQNEVTRSWSPVKTIEMNIKYWLLCRFPMFFIFGQDSKYMIYKLFSSGMRLFHNTLVSGPLCDGRWLLINGDGSWSLTFPFLRT